mmetsp:Transcript_22604/g.53358  ORF Transcript_22604/g.53358 Transcript_22604/m.53358 type:complete len:85 (+) Transcript_22604:3511-3765(+)
MNKLPFDDWRLFLESMLPKQAYLKNGPVVGTGVMCLTAVVVERRRMPSQRNTHGKSTWRATDYFSLRFYSSLWFLKYSQKESKQ